MKKTIEGNTYDTKTARVLMTIAKGSPYGSQWTREKLCRSPSGKFFLWCTGSPQSLYGKVVKGNYVAGEVIIPMTALMARVWVADRVKSDVYVRLFGNVR